VIEVDQEKLAQDKEKIEKQRKFIDLEKQNQEIRRKKLEQMPDGPDRQQWAMAIDAREEELSKVIPQLEEDEATIAAMEKGAQPSDIKIYLADGREFRAEYLQVSTKHDLALLSLHAIEGSYLRKHPANQPLQQGDKVLTIGSPVGLRHTVTAGVFSGYRQQESDGSMFLQTDAPINPGNSGGPLIDEEGYVYGVNTMILRDTEGIGFAIPIETVAEEFPSIFP
jgi:S1-C subfamily serine protease